MLALYQKENDKQYSFLIKGNEELEQLIGYGVTDNKVIQAKQIRKDVTSSKAYEAIRLFANTHRFELKGESLKKSENNNFEPSNPYCPGGG